jgi:hypothetical protein
LEESTGEGGELLPRNRCNESVSRGVSFLRLGIVKLGRVHGGGTGALKCGAFIFQDWPMPQSRKIKKFGFEVCS